MELFSTYISQAFLIVFIGSGVPLLVTAIVGLVCAVVQTAMQVQEQSTIFIIKLAAFVVIVFFGAEYFFMLLNRYINDSLATITTLGSLL